jgi:deoxyribodipyrimidine photo-lyase
MPSQPAILIALLRNDLRIVDNAIFHAAHNESLASRITHVLPVYVFDERQIELGGVEGYQKVSQKEARTPVGKVSREGAIH